MKTLGKQMLSLLLAVVLVLQLIPATVFAEQDNTPNPAVEAEEIQTDNYSETTQEELASAQILFEEESLREEDVKHFRLDNGLYIAVQYGTAVHYQDDGKWVDYDNTLQSVSALDGSGVSSYRVVNGESVRVFAADANAETLLVVAKENYSLSLTPVREADAEIPVDPNQPVVASLSPIETEEAALASPANILSLVSSGSEETDDSLLSQAQPEKMYSALEYADVFGSADLRYENYGNTIKESIVIAASQAEYVYAFQMETEGMTPTLQEDGSILLTSSEGAVIYSIPAPYMIDANNEYSYDVSYTLMGDNGNYILTVTADASWMNAEERAFPVLLDPTIIEENLGDDKVSGTYINSGYPDGTASSAAGVYVGNNDNENKMIHSLFHIDNDMLKKIPEGCEIVYAGFSLWHFDYTKQTGGSSKLAIGLYPMYSVNGTTTFDQTTSRWQNLMNVITWNGVYSNSAYYLFDYDTPMIDASHVNSSTEDSYITWDITLLAKMWEDQPESNLGFILKPVLEDDDVTSRAGFYGPEHTDTSHRPQMAIAYRNTVGVESKYTYQTAGIGRAGTAYISDVSLNNTIVVPLISSPSEVMPFSLSLVYNSVYGNTEFNTEEADLALDANTIPLHTEQFPKMKLGSGWKLSAQETVVSVNIGSTTYLIYTDADGTEHYFRYVGYSNGLKLYRDEDGLGLKITVDGTNFTMSDDYGNEKFFGNGYLKQAHDAYGNYIYYTYNGNKQLTKIERQNKDCTDKEELVSFTYHETNDRLLSVTDEAGRTISFTYTSSNSPLRLRDITFADGAKMQYRYTKDSNGTYRMTSAYDTEAGYGIAFTYRLNGTVSFFGEYVTTSKVYGAQFSAEKLAPNQTRYQYYGDDGIADNTDDLFSYKVLDVDGRTINSYSTDYTERRVLGVELANYTENSGTNKTNNRLTASASGGLQGINLLQNASMEDSSVSLAENAHWTRTGTGAQMATDGYLGSDCLCFFRTAAQTTVDQWYQTVTLEAGKSYTFSAYVKVPSGASFNTNGGVYLAFQNSSGSTISSSEMVNYSTQTAGGGWTRLSVTYYNSSTVSTSVRVAICASGYTGSIYADAAQLEEEKAASTFNLVEDGSFENTTSIATGERLHTWYKTGTASPSVETVSLFGGKAIKLEGNFADSDNYQRISRKVPVFAPLGSTFILSAWAKAAADPHSVAAKTVETDTYFGLILRFHYSDGTESDAMYYPFDPYYRDWQYMQGIAVPEKTGDDITIEYITIVVAYDNNINTAYIDNVAFRMEPVQTYSYNSDGNLTAASQTDSGTASAVYTGVDLTQYTAANGTTATYTYNNAHDILTAVSDGVTTTNGYDSSGNVLSSQLSGGGLTLSATAAYTSDRNNTARARDVNGSVMEYTYSSAGDRLERAAVKIPDPSDSTQEVEKSASVYTYDTAGRTTGVSLEASSQTLASISYTYSGGQLSALTRTNGSKTQTYNFSYNAWGQNTEIKVGSTSLATYQYENIGSSTNGGGNLASMTYGNGDSVSYTYDEFDRLSTVVYNDTGKCVEYAYNAEGALATITCFDGYGDPIAGFAFEYDSLGRLIRSREIDGNEALVQRTEHIYDAFGRLSSQSWIVGSSNFSETYSYNDGENGNGSLSQMTTATGDSLNYTYDPLHRLKNVAAKNSSGTTLFTTAYAYKVRTNGNTTPLVEFRNVRIGTSGTILEGKKYAYDAVGNITGIYESQLVGNNTERRQLVAYTYDEQNQLLSETYYTYSGTSTTPATTDVYSYTYDTVGNILTESKNGTVTKDYTYSTGDWKDLLTEFNGEEVTYDGAGNPLAYANSTSWYYFRWDHGRNLRFATVDNAESYYVGFDYDTDGIRTKKSVTVDSTGITTNHNYITQNGKVVRETIGSGTNAKVLDFIYDESGKPFALKYTNGTATPATYYYILNLQGDVVGLVNSSGAWVAEYTYNAWGEILSSSGDMAGTNPLRYRGYYYDSETGFYYLQSRYYDPVTHRFINADSYASTGQGIVGTNMFAYCGNNPVVRYDVGGSSWEEVWNWFKDTVDTVLHEGNVIAVSLGIDTAAIGAVFLDMYADENGVYHASFDCWQQYLGYNDLYDFFFDVGTSMASENFEFVCGTTQYMLWFWKGDYINLGAGIEAGIYTGSAPHWQVDTGVTINMSVMLRYNGSTIATYSADTWWATAFNPAYLNVSADSLSATYVFSFYNSREMFYSLYNLLSNDPRWLFDTRNYVASFSF